MAGSVRRESSPRGTVTVARGRLMILSRRAIPESTLPSVIFTREKTLGAAWRSPPPCRP